MADQATAYTADGQPIAPEDTAAAVREGRGFFQRGQRVTVRNPDGELVSVASEDATMPGYQVLSPAEIKQAKLKRDAESASGLVKTGAEGVARGATMGFLGPEQFYDAEGREAAAARQRYNPNLSAGSEIAGTIGATVATGLLTGGAGATTAGGRLAAMAGRGALTPFRAAAALGDAAEGGMAALRTGEGILNAGLRMGARGVAEGALMGAGHEVSQAALEDVPLTAERLLAGAWDGAKMGGAFGLGLGVLGAGVGKAGRAIVGRMAETGDDLGKATGTWAERAAFKQQVGNQGKFFDQATRFGSDPQGPARIGRKLLDAGMPTESRAALRRAKELADDAASRLKATADAADAVGAQADVTALLSRVDDQIAKLRETPFGDFQAIASRVEKQIAPFRARVTGNPALSEVNQVGLANAKFLRTGMRDESLEYARQARALAADGGAPVKPVRVDLYPGEPPVLNDGRHRLAAAVEAGDDKIAATVVRYDAGGNVVSEVTAPVSINPGGEVAPGKVSFSELWGLRKKLDETINWEAKQQGPAKEALSDVRNAFRAELDDALVRAGDSGNPELFSAWKQATEDYGDFALVKEGLKGLIKQRGKNRAISPTDYAAGGLMTLLSGGNPLAGAAAGAASAVAHKLIRERGLGVMARIADRSGGVASQMEMAGKVAAMVESPKRLALPAAVNVSEQFDRYSKALTAARADPAQFAERMSTATADLVLRAPKLAQQVQTTMMGDLAYLDELHPAPATRQGTTLTPQAKLPQFYAYNQKQAFVDAAMALDNPMGVFEDIARGELPLNKLDALKARRPLLFNEMRATVVKYTMTREEELPFSRRVLLGTAFSFPADWSMLHVGAIQESLAASDPSGKPNDPTAAPSKIGADPGQAISPGQF